MGYDTHARPYGLWTAISFVIGGVIGAGIFALPGAMAPFGWTGVVAWLVGGTGALVIGRVIAALVAARPGQTGLIAIVGEALGSSAGVLAGWAAWVSNCCANAVIALTAARYAGEWVPAIMVTPVRQAVAASAIIGLLTLLNLAGAKSAGWFQRLTTALKLLPLVAVIVIAFGMVVGGDQAFVQVVHRPFIPSDLVPATVLAMYAIIGFESASLAAERVHDPARNVARATMFGIAMTCLIYVAVCTAITFSIPANELTASGAPVALFIARHWGTGAGHAVALFAVVSTVGCLNVWIMLQGEIPLSLARAGQLPAWLGRTSARDVCVGPMVLSSVLSVLLLAAGASQGAAGILTFMLNLTAVAGVWIYAFAALAAFRLNLTRPLAVLAILFALAIMLGGGVEASGLSLLLLAAGLPFYLFARRSLAPIAV